MMGSGDPFVRTVLRNLVPVRLTRYDLLLWIIPLAFVVGLVAATVLSTPIRTGLFAASVVATLALFDGLFRNPPTTGSAA